MNQKIYILMTIGLYFYNLYQNFLSCHQFYKNAYYIIEKMNIFHKHPIYHKKSLRMLFQVYFDQIMYTDTN